MARIKLLVSCFPTFFIMLILHPPTSHACPEYQKEALLQFKLSLLGNISAADQHFLHFLGAWNSTTDCCQWDSYRVVCESQKVTELFLDPYGYPEEVASFGSTNALNPLFLIQTLTDISIRNMGLEGEVPPGTGNLTRLESLDLGNNRLSGSISSSLFFFLTELSHLDLSYNSLSMEIPSEMENFTKLEYLDVSNNELSGSIPSSLAHLKELTHLYLGANSLSSEIPLELGNLSNIINLHLEDNNLSGQIPPWIQNSGQLTTLNPEDNSLTGDIPTWLFSLRRLWHLQLGGNLLVLKNITTSMPPNSQLNSLSLRSCNISGHIPVWLSNFTYFSYLDLSENSLVGTLGDWFQSLPVGYLILSDNNLSGSISPLLFKQNLQYLDLSRNNFSGYLPDNIGEATSLETLILSGNDFSGPIPKSVSNLSLLYVLDLSKNRLSGSEFPNFLSLYVLDLSFNLFFGEIPVNLCDGMIMLVLCSNNFSCIFPRSLASLTSLSYLDLQDNNLVGKIPSFLFQISTLQILDLSNNYFEGHILSNLSNLTLLQILDVSGNKLSGTIPTGLGNLNGMIGYSYDLQHSLQINYTVHGTTPAKGYDYIQLNYPDLQVFWKESKRNLPNQHLDMYTLLDFSNNQLLGEIPDALGALRGLKVLNFSHNKLSGKIPSTTNGLENLESLDLSYNNLSGEIPEAIGNLLQLSTLKLSNNKLVGRIPTGPQRDRLNDPESYADNNRLCGIQIRVPCDMPQPNENAKESDEESMEDWWFSWKMEAIGFPSGYLSTVLVLYIIGYFNLLSKHQLRRHGRRRQYIMPCF